MKTPKVKLVKLVKLADLRRAKIKHLGGSDGYSARLPGWKYLLVFGSSKKAVRSELRSVALEWNVIAKLRNKILKARVAL